MPWVTNRSILVFENKNWLNIIQCIWRIRSGCKYPSVLLKQTQARVLRKLPDSNIKSGLGLINHVLRLQLSDRPWISLARLWCGIFNWKVYLYVITSTDSIDACVQEIFEVHHNREAQKNNTVFVTNLFSIFQCLNHSKCGFLLT